MDILDISSIAQANSVGPIRPSTPYPVETDPSVAGPATFGEMLKAAVNEVNDRIVSADDLSTRLALGEVQDVHEVMLAMEKASLSLQLTMEIRNKIIEAYQSIMRSQV